MILHPWHVSHYQHHQLPPQNECTPCRRDLQFLNYQDHLLHEKRVLEQLASTITHTPVMVAITLLPKCRYTRPALLSLVTHFFLPSVSECIVPVNDLSDTTCHIKQGYQLARSPLMVVISMNARVIHTTHIYYYSTVLQLVRVPGTLDARLLVFWQQLEHVASQRLVTVELAVVRAYHLSRHSTCSKRCIQYTITSQSTSVRSPSRDSLV